MTARPVRGYRSLIMWSMGGQGLFMVTMLLILVALARLTDVETVGVYGLVSSVIVPIFFVTGFNMRVNYASDAAGRYRFEEYAVLVFLAGLVGLAICLVTGAFVLGGEAFLLFFIMSAARAFEIVSGLSFGAFIRYERVPFVTFSICARMILSVPAVWIALWLGYSVEFALSAYLIATGAVSLCFDLPVSYWLARQAGHVGRPRGGEVWALARSSVSLSFATGVLALQNNIPRYIIVALLSVTALGYFAVLAYAINATTSMFSTVMNSMLSRIATNLNEGRRDAVWQLFGRLVAGTAVFAIVATGISLLIGGWLIEVVFGPDYSGLGLLLALSMVAAALRGAALIIENILLAQRDFGRVMGYRLLACVLIMVFCAIGAASLGLLGVPIGLCVAFVLYLAGLVLFVLPRAMAARGPGAAA